MKKTDSKSNALKYRFPEKFYWGAATSSHQVEGNLTNQWSEWEKKVSQTLASEAAGKFSWVPTWAKFQKEAENPENYISGVGANQFKYYRDDVSIMKSLNFNAYRFSIEWSRIEPEEGKFSAKGIQYYKDLIAELKTNGIEPFVTLWHWTLPVWLDEKGGVLSADFVKSFENLVKHVVKQLSPEVTYYITINESNVYTTCSYLTGEWPPQEKNPIDFLHANWRLVKAHRAAYKIIKAIDPDIQVGIAHSLGDHEAKTSSIFNRILKKLADTSGYLFIDLIKNYQDFVGINHYHHNLIDNGYVKNENKYISDLGWELHPASLGRIVSETYNRYKKPIFITENGLADYDDFQREWFLTESLKSLHKAIKDGADVRGYLHWSFLDNFEWDKGYWPRFGLVGADHKTGKRTVRKSAKRYGEIIRNGGL